MFSAARYAALLARRDLRRSIAASILGRLPIGIAGLAILLLAQSASGSYSEAGAVAAAYVVGLAAGAPLLGRLIDRSGPRLALASCGILYPVALVALLQALANHAALPAALALSACAGACLPPLTICMRTYLRRQLEDDGLLAAAYALESVLIETIFIAGPLLVALLVALVSAAAAVFAAAGCALAGTAWFLRSPAIRDWRRSPVRRTGFLGALAEPGFLPLLFAVLAYSGLFGLVEIGIAAYAVEAGEPALAGLMLALMSLGSAGGALAYGGRTWGLALARQFALVQAAIGPGLVPLLLVTAPVAFGAACLLAGILMGPVLVIQTMLVARIAQPDRLTESFTWCTSALLSGIGLGTAAGGWLIDWTEPRATFAGAALLALASGMFASLVLRSGTRAAGA